MKILACPGCQTGVSAKLVEHSGSYDLCLCPRCELTFCDPMRAGNPDFYEANTEYDQKWEFQFVLPEFTRLGLSGSLLDVGCGDGRFLSGVGKEFTVTGLDFNPSAIRTAQAERGLMDVHCETLEEFSRRPRPKPYDVITVFHILEHVEDPNGFLACIKKCLRPGGVLAASVPNPYRWTLRWIRETWDYPPHHLTRWMPHTLKNLLERQGFEIVEMCREPLQTFNQFLNCCRDIAWTIALGHSAAENVARPVDPPHRTWVRSTLSKLKGQVIKWLPALFAVALYPGIRLGRCEGKSLLVIARIRVPLK